MVKKDKKMKLRKGIPKFMASEWKGKRRDKYRMESCDTHNFCNEIFSIFFSFPFLYPVLRDCSSFYLLHFRFESLFLKTQQQLYKSLFQICYEQFLNMLI